MSQTYRYQAFVSYAHADGAFARRLHGELERFRIPKEVSFSASEGARPGALGRFFRDDDELAASPDLGEAIKAALANSQSLIVVCSPTAARSRWVGEEIAHFRDALGRRRIFAVICAGEPRAGEPDGAFHHNLVAKGFEPLAADFRTPNREARRDALIRLVAGLCGADYDTLKRRELARARQAALRNGVLALAAFGLAVVAGGASWLAWIANQRLGVALASETRARGEAEKALEAERAARERAQTMGASSQAQFAALNENAIDFARSLVNWPSDFEGAATVLLTASEEHGYDPEASVSHIYWNRCPRTLRDCFAGRPASIRALQQSVIAKIGNDPNVRIDARARDQFLRLCPSFSAPPSHPVLLACAGLPFDEVDASDPDSLMSQASLQFGVDNERGAVIATIAGNGYCGSGGCNFPSWFLLRNEAGRFAPASEREVYGDEFAIVFKPDGAFSELVSVSVGQAGIGDQMASVNRHRWSPASASLAPFAEFVLWEIYSAASLEDRSIPPVLRVCPSMVRATRGADDPCTRLASYRSE